MRLIPALQKHIFSKVFIVLIWLVLMLSPANGDDQRPKPGYRIKGKRVALVIPYSRYNRYFHEELSSALGAQGATMTIVSSRKGMANPNKGQIPVAVEMTIEQVDMAVFDALVFAGGGALYTEFTKNPTTERIIQLAIKMNKVVAGLDLGKAILVNAGAVDYKLPDNRDVIGAAVTVQGKVITGNSPYVVIPFIDALFTALQQE